MSYEIEHTGNSGTRKRREKYYDRAWEELNRTYASPYEAGDSAYDYADEYTQRNLAQDEWEQQQMGMPEPQFTSAYPARQVMDDPYQQDSQDTFIQRLAYESDMGLPEESQALLRKELDGTNEIEQQGKDESVIQRDEIDNMALEAQANEFTRVAELNSFTFLGSNENGVLVYTDTRIGEFFGRDEDGRFYLSDASGKEILTAGPTASGLLPIKNVQEARIYIGAIQANVNKVLTDPKHIDSIQFEGYGGQMLGSKGKPKNHVMEYQEVINNTKRLLNRLEEFKGSDQWTEISSKDRARIEKTLRSGRSILKLSRSMLAYVRSLAEAYTKAGKALPLAGIKFKTRDKDVRAGDFLDEADLRPRSNRLKKLGMRSLQIAGTGFTLYSIYDVADDPQANSLDVAFQLPGISLLYGDLPRSYQAAQRAILEQMQREKEKLMSENS